jgi:hypothetical protein
MTQGREQMASKSAPQYASNLEKAPTDLQTRMADWLIEKTGVDPDSLSPREAFNVGVKLAVALRMVFQASPENKKATADRRASKAPAGQAVRNEVTETVASSEKPRKAPAAPAKKAPARPARRRGKATAAASEF